MDRSGCIHPNDLIRFPQRDMAVIRLAVDAVLWNGAMLTLRLPDSSPGPTREPGSLLLVGTGSRRCSPR